MINYQEVNGHFNAADTPPHVCGTNKKGNANRTDSANRTGEANQARQRCAAPLKPSAKAFKLSKADKEIIADYIHYKIKEKMYDLEDENIEFVANSPFYHDDYFYGQARDLILEELETAARDGRLADFFDDEIDCADALKNEIIAFAGEGF